MKKKGVSTINDSVYYESGEHVDTISDSNKQVEPINDPIQETHIVDRFRILSVRIGLFEPAVVIGGSIRPVTNVLDDSRVELPLDSLSPLNTNQSKAFVFGSQFKSVGVNRNILNCTSLDSRNIWQNNSWIGTPRVNKGIFSPSCDLTKTSRLWSCTGSIDPLDTSIHGSATQKTNSGLSCIEKDGVKSVLGEIVPDLDPIKRVNLANSVLSESPKFKSLGLPDVVATDIHNIDFVSSSRVNSLSGTQKNNVTPFRMGCTHDFETMSETTAYRNHIKNSDIETREVFEQET